METYKFRVTISFSETDKIDKEYSCFVSIDQSIILKIASLNNCDFDTLNSLIRKLKSLDIDEYKKEHIELGSISIEELKKIDFDNLNLFDLKNRVEAEVKKDEVDYFEDHFADRSVLDESLINLDNPMYYANYIAHIK